MIVAQSGPPRPDSFTEPKLLLVEGPDDDRFFTALARHLDTVHLQILSYGGKTNLRRYLSVTLVTPGFEDVVSIGVVRDADTSAANTFTSVRDALIAAKLPAPSGPLISTQTTPQVIVAIIPPGQPEGELEDLCLESVSNDPTMDCVDKYFECLKTFPEVNPQPLVKGKVHVFLASRNTPNRRLGEAADAGEWPWDSPVFDDLKSMLSRL